MVGTARDPVWTQSCSGDSGMVPVRASSSRSSGRQRVLTRLTSRAAGGTGFRDPGLSAVTRLVWLVKDSRVAFCGIALGPEHSVQLSGLPGCFRS